LKLKKGTNHKLKTFRKEKTRSFFREKYSEELKGSIYQLTIPFTDKEGKPYYKFFYDGKQLILEGELHEFNNELEAGKFNKELVNKISKENIYFKEEVKTWTY